MNNSFDTLALEQAIKQQFAVALDIAEVIVRDTPVGMAAQATLFKTKSGQLLAYVTSRSAQVLDDMLKTVRRMNCESDHIYPPHGDADYFTRVASEKFKAMFPGKHITSDDDLRYYKNIALYNPALFRLAKVKGDIRGFDRQSSQWRKVRDYAYNKIAPS